MSIIENPFYFVGDTIVFLDRTIAVCELNQSEHDQGIGNVFFKYKYKMLCIISSQVCPEITVLKFILKKNPDKY